MKLKRCPFCNGHDLTVELTENTSFIRCFDCGAVGPQAIVRGKSLKRAVKLWNNGEDGSTSLVNLPPGESNRDDLKDIEL